MAPTPQTDGRLSLHPWPVLLRASVLILTACGLNRAGLTRDVRQLFDQCNIKPPINRVTMGDRTRTGMVEITATPEDIAAIVNRLGLQEIVSATGDPDRPGWLAARVLQFDHPLLRPQRGVRVFQSSGPPATLRLPNGTAFHSLLLFWDSEKRVAVILLSYAYG